MGNWSGQSSYGDVEFRWSDDPYGYASPGEGRTGSIHVDEPYRETSGHSSRVTPEMARGLAAELIAFADWAEANPPLPRASI